MYAVFNMSSVFVKLEGCELVCVACVCVVPTYFAVVTAVIIFSNTDSFRTCKEDRDRGSYSKSNII